MPRSAGASPEVRRPEQGTWCDENHRCSVPTGCDTLLYPEKDMAPAAPAGVGRQHRLLRDLRDLRGGDDRAGGDRDHVGGAPRHGRAAGLAGAPRSTAYAGSNRRDRRTAGQRHRERRQPLRSARAGAASFTDRVRARWAQRRHLTDDGRDGRRRSRHPRRAHRLRPRRRRQPGRRPGGHAPGAHRGATSGPIASSAPRSGPSTARPTPASRRPENAERMADHLARREGHRHLPPRHLRRPVGVLAEAARRCMPTPGCGPSSSPGSTTRTWRTPPSRSRW